MSAINWSEDGAADTARVLETIQLAHSSALSPAETRRSAERVTKVTSCVRNSVRMSDSGRTALSSFLARFHSCCCSLPVGRSLRASPSSAAPSASSTVTGLLTATAGRRVAASSRPRAIMSGHRRLSLPLWRCGMVIRDTRW